MYPWSTGLPSTAHGDCCITYRQTNGDAQSQEAGRHFQKAPPSYSNRTANVLPPVGIMVIGTTVTSKLEADVTVGPRFETPWKRFVCLGRDM